MAGDFFESAKEMWWSPLGSALITLSFAYPVSCDPRLPPRTSEEAVRNLTDKSNCDNFWGGTPFTPDEAGATVMAFGIGLLCWGVASAIRDATKPKPPAQ